MLRYLVIPQERTTNLPRQGQFSAFGDSLEPPYITGCEVNRQWLARL